MIENKKTNVIKTGNSGPFLLPLWRKKCNQKNDGGKNLKEEQKQKAPQKTREQRAYLLWEEFSCIFKHVVMIMFKMFLLVLRE